MTEYKPRREFSESVGSLLNDLGNLSDGSIRAGRDEWEWFCRQIVIQLEAAYRMGFDAGFDMNVQMQKVAPEDGDISRWADKSLGDEPRLYADAADKVMRAWRDRADEERE